MKRRKSATPKERMVWAGFVDGRLDNWSSVGYGHPIKAVRSDMPALFLRKADAVAAYEDVRRVRIVPADAAKRLRGKR